MKMFGQKNHETHLTHKTDTLEKAKRKVKSGDPKRRRMFNFGNIRIAPKLLAGFLIIALLSASMVAYAAMNINRVSGTVKSLYSDVVMPTKNLANIIKEFDNEKTNLRHALLFENEMSLCISNIKGSDSMIAADLKKLESAIPREYASDYSNMVSKYNAYKRCLFDATSKLKSGDKQPVLDSLASGELKNAEIGAQRAFDSLMFSVTCNAEIVSNESIKTSNTVLLITILTCGAVLALSALIGIFIAGNISRPIKKMTDNFKLLAAGETDIDVSGADTKDEVGQMREAFRKILKVIRDLSEDTDMLITAATQGRLSVRADAGKHQGAYRKIVEGINATLDAMISPIIESSNALEQLADGNLNVAVSGNFEGDFEMIKKSVNNTIGILNSYIGEISEVLGKIAAGELDRKIEQEFKGDFIVLKEAINKSINAFSGVLRDIDLAAQEVAVGSMQLSNASLTISKGVTAQSGALEELNASLSEMSKQTARNAERANLANGISLAAKNNALIGKGKMQTLQSAMQEIYEASKNISKIIKVIDDIAFQTNILSLNAAIEAAKAGTYGKGFAVVADEVRGLAARTTNAARETAALIENSSQKTGAGAEIADEAAKALLKIVEGVEKTVELSDEIAAASIEQAEGIEKISKGIEQLSRVVQTNSATSQETAGFSEQLSVRANILKEMVGRFKLNESESEI